MQTLQPVHRGRLYEQVVARVRDHIDLEGLQPGDRLMPEREMAQRLGVSRTSLRQALTALEVMGLVEIRHGGGVFITRPPETVLTHLAAALADFHEQLPEIMEVRQAIEAQTARLAAIRHDEQTLACLNASIDAMAASTSDLEAVAEADKCFHDGIVKAAGNPLLQELWQKMARPIDSTRRASLARPGRPASSLHAHRQILSAIAARSPEAASRAMLKHLETVADVGFLTTLRSSPDKDAPPTPERSST